MPPRLSVSFIAGPSGPWSVEDLTPIVGGGLPAAPRLAVYEGNEALNANYAWVLRGVTSHERYVERVERERLVAREPGLGRAEATRAALIPIRKSEAWWELPQDERRAIFEARSRHIAVGLDYLPAVARRLHHCRDLGAPFDFLTWFEFAPSDEAAFDELVARLRKTEEWTYVEREIDIRLAR